MKAHGVSWMMSVGRRRMQTMVLIEQSCFAPNPLIENRKEGVGGDDSRGYHLNFSVPLIRQSHGRESCNG